MISTRNEGETSDELALGDPSDVDFVDQLAEAIRGLIDLGRPSTSKDRSQIRAERNLSRAVFSYLAKKGIIVPVGESEHERELISEAADIARDRDQLLAYLWDRVGIGRGGRRQPSLYVETIHDRLRVWAADQGLPAEAGERGHVLASKRDWKEILWQPLRAAADSWIAPPDRHRWLHHMRSSQSFALNLFGPVKAGASWARELWAEHFPAVSSVEFEYPSAGDPLGEVTPQRRSRTRVDVRLDSPSDTWLIEVKLTEPEFGPCSAGHDSDNLLRPLSCDAPLQSLDVLREHCYLNQLGRLYFPLLEKNDSLVDVTKLAAHGARGCPLRQDLYQIVRTLLLVQHVRASEGRRARFAVVAPSVDLNPTLHEAAGDDATLTRFIQSILKASEQDAVVVVDFTQVVEAGERHEEEQARDWSLYMRRRYIEPLVAPSLPT